MLCEVDAYLLGTNISITSRRGRLFLKSMIWILIYYAPRSWCLLLMTAKWTLIYYTSLLRSLFIMLRKANAYFSCPVRQMLISYIPWIRCLSLILCEIDLFFLHEANAYLLYSARQALISRSVKRIFIMSVRWMFVPRSTSHVTRPFSTEEVEPVSFTGILYIYPHI